MNPVSAMLVGLIMIITLIWQFRLWKVWAGGHLRHPIYAIDAMFESTLDVLRVAMTLAFGERNDMEGNTATFFGFSLPVAISIVAAAGIIILSFISLFDSSNSFGLGSFIVYIFKALVLVVVTVFKSALGILLSGYVFSVEVYYFFTYGELRSVPIISALLDWIFSLGPDWVGNVWLVIQVMWSIVTGAIFSAFD